MHPRCSLSAVRPSCVVVGVSTGGGQELDTHQPTVRTDGGPEPEKEAIQQFEMLFQGLAAVGVTTIAASGDQGATFSDISATNTCAKYASAYVTRPAGMA